jgi:hypothetical protein
MAAAEQPRHAKEQAVKLTTKAPPPPGTGPSSYRHVLTHDDAIIPTLGGAQQLWGRAMEVPSGKGHRRGRR